MAWTRADTFGSNFTARSLSEFTTPTEPVEWETENPYSDSPRSELLETMLSEPQWRYHHGIAEMAESPNLYSAYAGRVDAMLDMLGRSLAGANIARSSFVDLAGAEGYVANWLSDSGATDIDLVDLNEGNFRRVHMVRAVTGRKAAGRVGRLDLERNDWSQALGRTYDVTLALGIVYHLENPMLWLRNLYAITDRMTVVESDTPTFPDNKRFRGFGVTYLHRDRVTLAPGNVRFITEFRPDRQALAEMLLAVGFERVEAVAPSTVHPCRYFDTGEKSMLVAYKS